ncbi:MAG: threonine aldolase family protein [Mycobacteriales bacterium]
MPAAVDLRSDTRTVPDPQMRAAMAAAEVGDDSFGDDPTVRELEDRAADLAGTEAAVFTCGGTMSNLLAVLALAGVDRGALVVAGAESHLVHYENDGVRTLGRVRVATVPDRPVGELDPVALDRALADPAAGPRVVTLENTSNRCGGSALDQAAMRRQIEPAWRAGAAVHLDGARLPNAAVALDRPVAELARGVDTVAISLCKGLGAPAGSVLCGTAAVLERVRYLRRMVGGTMHQSGVLAAAGLVALTRLPRLAEDHRRAALLAARLRELPRLAVRRTPHPTNMVMVRLPGTAAALLADRLAAHGVLGLPVTAEEVRLVVHAGHADQDILAAAARVAAAVSARAALAHSTSKGPGS